MIGRRLAVALAVVLLLPATAEAHATLERTAPAPGAQLDRAPAQVELYFDDAVNAQLGAVRVFDARGQAVQLGDAFHPGGRGGDVAVRLPATLPQGGYTVTYRVISDDGHPLAGGFRFSVGQGGAAGTSVAHLLRGQTAGPVTGTGFSVVRAVQYAALAVALGGLIFVVWCWAPGLAAVRRENPAWDAAAAGFAVRERALLGVAAVAGLVSAVAAIGLEGAEGRGSSVWNALASPVIHDVLDTRFGVVWALAALAWLVVGMWVLIDAPPAGLLVIVAPLALLPALSGHPSTQSPVWLLLPANVAHVLAMSAWLGGIFALVLALPAPTRRLEPAGRTQLSGVVLRRFSALAGVAFALLFMTGAIQGIAEVASVPALVDTAFGRAVLIKLMLFAALVGLGWRNRRRSRGPGDPRVKFALRVELGLGLAAIAVTGALAGYAPPVT